MAETDHGATPAVLMLGAGFLGAAITRALLERGCPVTVLTRSEPSEHQQTLLAGAAVLVGDVSGTAPLAAALVEADHVVFALGSSSPIESDLDPAGDISAIVPPVIRLLELLRLRPEVGVTFLSSGGAVYGDKRSRRIRETAVPDPVSSYGIIKLTCEKYLGMYADAHAIPVRILRIANAYGPGQPSGRGQGLVARLIRSAAVGEQVPLYGPDESVRDFVYIDDVATSVADLVCTPNPVPRVVNIGSGAGHSVTDVVRLVEEVTGQQIPTRVLCRRAFDVRSNVLDISRLHSVIHFRPVDLRTGIERTWKALLELEAGPAPAGAAVIL